MKSFEKGVNLELSPKEFKEQWSQEPDPQYKCVCGNLHTLSTIKYVWGLDDLNELIEYLDENPLYMGCNQYCIP